MDDLTKISGIGEATARKLNEAGVTTFLEIAQWTADDIDFHDNELALKGSPRRDDWIEQAIALAAGAFSADNPEKAEKAAEVVAAMRKENDDALSVAVERMKALEAELAALKVAAPSVAMPEAPKAEKARVRRHLNKNRKYAEIVGQHAGAAFVQIINGVEIYFDGSGKEIFTTTEVFENRDMKTGIPIEMKYAKQVELTGDEVELPPPPLDEDNIHFVNWLDGKSPPEVTWPVIQRAIKKQLGKTCKTEKEGRQFLHETFRARN